MAPSSLPVPAARRAQRGWRSPGGETCGRRRPRPDPPGGSGEGRGGDGRAGEGRGRLGGELAALGPPGRRQNAPWIPAAGAGSPGRPPAAGPARGSQGPGARPAPGLRGVPPRERTARTPPSHRCCLPELPGSNQDGAARPTPVISTAQSRPPRLASPRTAKLMVEGVHGTLQLRSTF